MISTLHLTALSSQTAKSSKLKFTLTDKVKGAMFSKWQIATDWEMLHLGLTYFLVFIPGEKKYQYQYQEKKSSLITD